MTYTLLTAGNSASNATSYNTASVSIDGSKGPVIVVFNFQTASGSQNTATPTLSGAGQTWPSPDYDGIPSHYGAITTFNRSTIWVFDSPTTGSGAITISYANTMDDGCWAVIQLDAGFTVGTREGVNTVLGTSNTISMALTGVGASDYYLSAILWTGYASDDAGGFTPRSGWTEITEQRGGAGQGYGDSLQVQISAIGGDTTASVTTGNSTGYLAIAAYPIEASAGGTDALTADDVEAASEVTAPAVGQIHAITAVSAESASETTSAAIGQIHALAADDTESASEVSAPSVGQIHDLTATSVESAAEISAPTLAVVYALTASDVEAASEVTAPAVGQIHALLADDAESATETTAPSIGQVHALLADDIESASEVTAPTAAEAGGDVLSAESVEAASEVSAPTLAQVHVLLADDVDAAGEVSTPSVGQVHALTADDVEAGSEVSAPAAADIAPPLYAVSVEAASEVSAPTLAQVHVISVSDAYAFAEVSAPYLSTSPRKRSKDRVVHVGRMVALATATRTTPVRKTMSANSVRVAKRGK